MVKMEPEIISKMENVVMEQTSASKNAYLEIAIIQYARNLESGASVNKNESENDDKRGQALLKSEVPSIILFDQP